MTRTSDQIYDELLVLRCRDGDTEAFTELVGRWQARLYGHALQLTGRRDAAQDAVQETWVAIVRGLARLEDPASFPGFAHRILARRCVDWTRGQQRGRRMRDALAEPPESTPKRGPSAAERESDATRLRELLAKMPSDRRVLLALHYLQDVPVARIASILHVPQGTVKSRLHTARAELKRALEGRSPCPSSTS